MQHKKSRKSLKFIIDDWIAIKKNPYILFLIIILLPLIYFLVYSTGGIKFVYSHSMYIPIILAGIFYGPYVGGFIAFVAAILLGPLMPIDTLTNEMQDPMNWLYRMLIFILVGSIIGYASNRLRKDADHIENLMSVNQETLVPNTNHLKKIYESLDFSTYSIFTVLINNHQNIIDILGIQIYHSLIHQIFVDLKRGLPEKSYIVQSDSNKLWVMTPFNDLESDVKKVIAIIKETKQIKNVPLYVDLSIGVTTCHSFGECKTVTVFEDSDVSARHAQINNLLYVIGDKEKYRRRTDYELLASFNEALINKETFLVFQPKIDLSTQKTFGFEALTRWNHPTRGNIPPDVFVPLIEETKLIHAFTDWVLKNALIKCKEMMNQGHNLPISINVSAKNLYDPKFYDRSMEIIKDYDVPTHLIEFELTESTLMINPKESRKILQNFVDQGIKISLDDFGSGYSSLAYLTQFPIHFIKIDRFFIQNIVNDHSMLTIVESTIELSKNLGYKVIVEGVETKEVADLVISKGCDYAQGYYYAKPMTSKDVSEWYELNS